MQRTITAGGNTYLENLYSDETSCEIIFRKLSMVQRMMWSVVTVARTRWRSNSTKGTCLQIHGAVGMPKSVALSSIEAFVREASRMNREADDRWLWHHLGPHPRLLS